MSLRVVIGPMFAGKTSEIQSVVRRFNCLGKTVLVLTASIDDRYGTASVISHDRSSIPATAVDIHGGLRAVVSSPEFLAATAIVVDEAQFFVNCLVEFVRIAVDEYGKHVTVGGLDGDANRRPFGDVLALIPLADSVEKRTALCLKCGDGTVALFSRKLVADEEASEQVSVGGADKYEPVCRKHFH